MDAAADCSAGGGAIPAARIGWMVDLKPQAHLLLLLLVCKQGHDGQRFPAILPPSLSPRRPSHLSLSAPSLCLRVHCVHIGIACTCALQSNPGRSAERRVATVLCARKVSGKRDEKESPFFHSFLNVRGPKESKKKEQYMRTKPRR